ncbi:MAG: trigger factor [Verrucomicrobia bacterium]|nr:trigger factor [Verrucomicrobiota bacterium]
MKVRIQDVGPCRKELQVEVPRETVGEEYNRVLGMYRKGVSVPGFRKGKAPEYVVKKRFSREIDQAVQDELIPSGYREAIEQESLDVVSILDVRNVVYSPSDPLTFSVTLDVPPQFKLPKYEGMKLKRQEVTVGEEEVEDALRSLRDRQASYEDVTDRAVKAGDMVQVDFEGTCDGQPIEEIDPAARGLGSAVDFWVLTDENTFLPGFGPGLIGASAGESKDIAVTFPADFTVAAIAGKDAHYKVMVKAVQEKRLPEITEDFLKPFEVDSEQALRAKIREDLLKMGEERENQRLKNEIVKQLLSDTKIDVPESLVQQETKDIVYDIVRENTSRGITREQIEESRDQIFDTATKGATERIKVRYILHKIAEEKDITVADQELSDHVARMAQEYGMTADAFRQQLERRNVLDNIREQMKSSKTLDFVLEQAKIKG